MKKLVYTLVALLILVPVIALACPPDKVQICHATSSEVNPFNLIEVSKNASVQGHDGHSDDIIPPFDYSGEEDVTQFRHKKLFGWEDWQDGTCADNPDSYWPYGCQERTVKRDILMHYPGKNLTTDYNGASGAEVLANGCQVPFTPPEPNFKTANDVDCEGVLEYTFQQDWVGGADGHFGDWYVIDSVYIHLWTNPYELEEWQANPPESQLFKEPAFCDQQEPSDGFVHEEDCDGWIVFHVDYLDGVEVDRQEEESGKWQDIHTLEIAPLKGEYDFGDVLEPRQCYVCDEHFVQEFNDGWCTIFVREPNIMPGMTRPNDWSQNLFCGCQYAHSDGWSVRMISSCGDLAEYEYYMAKPEGCGALICQ